MKKTFFSMGILFLGLALLLINVHAQVHRGANVDIENLPEELRILDIKDYF